MRPVEVVLTDDLALKNRLALDMILEDEERYILTDEERADYQRLAVLMAQAATYPEQFPVTGRQAARVRGVFRAAKGAAQPQSLRKKRAGRHQRRRALRHIVRRDREHAAQFNAAQEITEKEAAEAEAFWAEAEARIADQPKFEIRDMKGAVILSDIPAEAIVGADGTTPFRDSGKRLILPPGARE